MQVPRGTKHVNKIIVFDGSKHSDSTFRYFEVLSFGTSIVQIPSCEAAKGRGQSFYTGVPVDTAKYYMCETALLPVLQST